MTWICLEFTDYEHRIRRYRPCWADEAVQASGLRKDTEADFKCSNLQSGGSSWEDTAGEKDDVRPLLWKVWIKYLNT